MGPIADCPLIACLPREAAIPVTTPYRSFSRNFWIPGSGRHPTPISVVQIQAANAIGVSIQAEFRSSISVRTFAAKS